MCPLAAPLEQLPVRADQERHRLHHQGRVWGECRSITRQPGLAHAQPLPLAFLPNRQRPCVPLVPLPCTPSRPLLPPLLLQKTPETTVLQDLLTYSVKGLSCWVHWAAAQGVQVPQEAYK